MPSQRRLNSHGPGFRFLHTRRGSCLDFKYSGQTSMPIAQPRSFPPQVMSIKTRAGRPPGLDRQSCHCVTLLQRLCLDSQQAKRLVRNSSAQLLSWGARASRRAEKTGTRTYIQYCPRTWPVHLLDVPSGNHGVTRLGNPGAVQE